MGEYIKHPSTGEEIKIGVGCGHHIRYFYTREQLQQFKEQGYRGFYDGKWDATLETALHIPEGFVGLYPLPKNDCFDINLHTIILETNNLEHDTVTVQKKGNRGSVYTWTGLPCEYKRGEKMYAVPKAIAIRSDDRPYTLFTCDCCGTPFSITADEAQRILEKHPYWKNIIIPRVAECYLCQSEATCNCTECGRLFCEECHGIHCCEGLVKD